MRKGGSYIKAFDDVVKLLASPSLAFPIEIGTKSVSPEATGQGLRDRQFIGRIIKFLQRSDESFTS